MIQLFLIEYSSIAAVLFLTGIIFGMILKKDDLGNGVRLGVGNSFLLSIAWPITLGFVLVGGIFAVAKVWKKL